MYKINNFFMNPMELTKKLDFSNSDMRITKCTIEDSTWPSLKSHGAFKQRKDIDTHNNKTNFEEFHWDYSYIHFIWKVFWIKSCSKYWRKVILFEKRYLFLETPRLNQSIHFVFSKIRCAFAKQSTCINSMDPVNK